jgi:hypothetical protein
VQETQPFLIYAHSISIVAPILFKININYDHQATAVPNQLKLQFKDITGINIY